MKITTKMVAKAFADINKGDTTAHEAVAESLNEQLNKPANLHPWLKWKDQEVGVPVTVEAGAGILLGRGFVHMKGDECATNIDSILIKPNLSCRGYWKVDPENPLTEKPEGLRNNTLLIPWTNNQDVFRQPVIAAHGIGNWKVITAFQIIEP